MTAPPYAVLRAYDQRVAGMLADPEVTGDLLLIGLWLARATILRQPEPDETGWHLSDIARDVFPIRTKPAMQTLGAATAQETAPDSWKVAEVLKRDIRRYDVWADQPGPRGYYTPCGGPMARKDRCGKPVTIGGFLTDPNTGRARGIGACRKHTGWWREQVAANRAACRDVEVPRPPANVGGKLAAHITGLDWPALWVGLDPHWTPPPEVDSWERPPLRLVVSRDSTPIHTPTAARQSHLRPRFALIPGAQSSPNQA